MVVALALVVAGCGADPVAGPAGSDDAEPAAAVPSDVADCAPFTADGQSIAGEDALPSLRLPCLAGGPDVSMDDLGSRPVLVNLWASWCGPCREEMPMLQAAYERSGSQVGFLGVTTQDTRSASASFLGDFGVTYAHVVDDDGTLLKELAVPGLPVTLAVDADGRIIDRQIGQLTESRLAELVAKLEAAAAPAS
jgi:thiol-disulfide isomerase/thioredoxin